MLSCTSCTTPLSPVYSSIPSLQTQNPSSIPISQTPSKTSWVESLRSQVRSNSFRLAISTYIHFTSSGFEPDNFVFPAVLKAATALHDLNLCKQIHTSAIKLGYDRSSSAVANTLLHMYGKCGDIREVFKMFDKITQRDQVSWNSFINALCKFEQWGLALDAFRLMGLEGIEPSSFTLVSMALACSNLLDKEEGLRLGKQVHGYYLRNNVRKTFTNNALMTMYAKLGKLDDSRAMFEVFEDRDMVSWNTMISALSQNERFKDALELLRYMIL